MSMPLSDLLNALCQLTPLEEAGDWDNVGLLLEGSRRELSKVLLTLDISPEVVAEAIENDVDLLIAYHPPIFRGLKRLTREDPLTAMMLDLLEAGISLFSPHSALDAATGGFSDSLMARFPPHALQLREGSLRIFELEEEISRDELAAYLQQEVPLPYLRVAGAAGPLKRIALCPGAGASTFIGLQDLDAVFTGEMKHHEILEQVRLGRAVLISEHGHSERPLLEDYQRRLEEQISGLEFSRAVSDRESLELFGVD